MRISTALGVAMALVAAPAMAQVSSDPIRITTHDWSGQIVNANILSLILQEAGYNTELVQADYIAQFAGLRTGDLTVAVEIWETTGREAMDAAFATGEVINLGEGGMQAIEEWWYPSYMEDICPGLPNWEALNDCAADFATAETAPFGRYLGGPVTWGGFDEERIEALELDYEVVHAGTDAALFAELESAYQRQAPVLLWVYVPHWAASRYEGSFIEFPAYTPECYSDPSWGINPDLAYDCGKPRGPIWTVAWAGIEDQWPGAADVIRNYQISNEDMGALVAQIDLEGVSVEDAAAAWVAANAEAIQGWIQ